MDPDEAPSDMEEVDRVSESGLYDDEAGQSSESAIFDDAARVSQESIPPSVGEPVDLWAAFDQMLEDGGTVEFAALIETYYQSKTNPDHRQRARFRQYRAQLEQKGYREGWLSRTFFLDAVRGGAILELDGDLWIEVPNELTDPRTTKLLFDCRRLDRRAKQYLDGAERDDSKNMIFDVVSGLFQAIDSIVSVNMPLGGQALERTLDLYQSELARAEEYFEASAQRRAQVKYFRGMLLGAGLLYVVSLPFSIVLMNSPLGSNHPNLALLLAAIFAGCNGAIVSVLTRMTRGRLNLDYTMGSVVRNLGIFRPILGAILGAAVLVLIKGGLLAVVSIPESLSTQLYFFAGLAFIAGFSERFAQDMLGATERGVSAAGREPTAGQ